MFSYCFDEYSFFFLIFQIDGKILYFLFYFKEQILKDLNTALGLCIKIYKYDIEEDAFKLQNNMYDISF